MKIKALVWLRYRIERGPHETFETEGPVVYDDASEIVTFPEWEGPAGRYINMRYVERLEFHLEQ